MISLYRATRNSAHPREPPGWPELTLWTIRKMSRRTCVVSSFSCVIDIFGFLKLVRPNLNLIINSNLNVPETLILKTLTLAKKLLSQGNIKSIELYTSLDTYGSQAEYIRHGMKYDHVLRNAKLFLNKVSDIKVTFMCTFNIFCFPSFLPFLKDISSFKNQKNLQRWNKKENNSHLILNPVGCIKQIDVKNIIELIRYKLKEN